MKFKKIGTKLLAGILPVVIIAMASLTLISTQTGRTLVREQTQERMTAELAVQEAVINNELTVISNTVQSVAGTVGNSYVSSTQYNLETTLQQVVQENDSIYGSGIWFEPNAFSGADKYMAPYVHRVDGKSALVTTYERSDETYDYFNRDFYLLAQTVDKPTFVSASYDELAGKMILTCTMPMKNVLGNFIGCVTIDMDLAAVQNLVAELQVGETGSAMILDGDTGMYIGCTDAAKVDAGASILEEESASLVQAGQQILDAESGIISYTAGGESYQAYFDTMSEVNWKLVMQVPQSELDEPIVELVERLIIVGIIAIIISILAILRQVRNISGSIRKVQNFAGTLAEGDFSVPQLVVKSKDELGRMSTSLNAMYDSNKSVLMGISTQAGEIRESSVSLNQSAEQLRHQFENITELMTDVNEAMQSASAAAQQVNASAEEVSSSVNLLAGETEKSRSTTEEIKERAKNVENSSKEAYASALRLSSEYERNLSKSIENAQIVESIGQMAEVISGIAGQINLLSLNASIEAARVGEAGKGFAVVASEIGKLAGETSAAVENIQKTIDNIREAFELLTNDSKSLIAFLKETVTPDYDKFVGVAKQYGDDAVTIEEISSRISDMAENIENIMSEVTNAVQNIAESVQSTADDSSQITNTMEQVTGVVEQVSEMSEDQEKIAGSLNEVVNKFKLE